MEYFYGAEALQAHVAENPCILDEWPQLWLRLQRAEWSETVNAASGCTCYSLGFSQQYLFAPVDVIKSGGSDLYWREETRKGLEPGVHLFASNAAVVFFIAR